jgi:hypothetical protein
MSLGFGFLKKSDPVFLKNAFLGPIPLQAIFCTQSRVFDIRFNLGLSCDNRWQQGFFYSILPAEKFG